MAKIQLGATPSNIKQVRNYKGEVAAGRVVYQDTDGTINGTGTGNIVGISLGKDLSNAGYTSVCLEGAKVPLLIASDAGLTPNVKDQVKVIAGLVSDAGSAGVAITATYFSTEKFDAVNEDGTANPLKCYLVDYFGGI